MFEHVWKGQVPWLFQNHRDLALRTAGTERDRRDAPLASAMIEIFKKKPRLALPDDGKGVRKEAIGLVAQDLPRTTAEVPTVPDVVALIDESPADPPMRRIEG